MSPSELEALAQLEHRTVAVDGGRDKLEWGVLRSRSGPDVHDLLAWDGDRLIGFLGLYGFARPTLELAGMVDPQRRREGVGSALLDQALALGGGQDFAKALLVTPRDNAASAAFAKHRGGVLEHSEHALVQRAAPPDGRHDPDLTVRAATTADVPAFSRILRDAFGGPGIDPTDRLDSTRAIVRSGDVVGTLFVNRDGDSAGVYGFAVAPELQGHGIGRDALQRVCVDLRSAGVTEIALEVAVENDHALGLYTSLGFEPVTTEDYFELRIGGPLSDSAATLAP